MIYHTKVLLLPGPWGDITEKSRLLEVIFKFFFRDVNQDIYL